MHGVGELALEHEGLKSSLHHLGHGQSQDVIQLSFGFLEKSKSYHSSDKCITYQEFIIDSILNIIPSKSLLGSFSSRVNSSLAAFLHCGLHSVCANEGILPDFGQSELHSPDLSLVFQTISSDHLQSIHGRVKIGISTQNRVCLFRMFSLEFQLSCYLWKRVRGVSVQFTQDFVIWKLLVQLIYLSKYLMIVSHII